MNIITRKSKLWKLWNILFSNADMSRVYIAFGRTVFTPGYASADIISHESIHLEQQKHSYLYAIWWWIKYKFSKKFRYSQELEAYRKQLEFLRVATTMQVKDRNHRVKVLRQYEHGIAEVLSGPLYNHMVPYPQAINDLLK